jgi:hypothetical protein
MAANQRPPRCQVGFEPIPFLPKVQSPESGNQGTVQIPIPQATEPSPATASSYQHVYDGMGRRVQ